MRKHIRNIPSLNFIKKTFFLFLFSCVYYNTFYNAEVNYEKAEKIIQQTNQAKSSDQIPAQAKKLLGKAIENSNIVINEYPDSKYVDDAYFIIGKASFLRKEFFNSEKYLSKLINFYPDSEHAKEARIYLAYTYLKMDNIDEAEKKLSQLTDYNEKKYQYLINNIFAELSIENKYPFESYNYYNKCLLFAEDKSQKASIYLKLLNVSKEYEHIDSSIVYLDQLSQYLSDEKKKDVKLDWIQLNRKAGNFDNLIIEIDNMLADPEYSNIYIKLKLERAKAYLDQYDFESAKIFFSELSDEYQRKNESAESLYHLGYIALMESFDVELALEYFEKSKTDRKTSLYGKRSRDMINKINDYKNLKQELDFSLNIEDDPDDGVIKGESKNKLMPKPKQKISSPDSIMFAISEKLLFDFDRLDDAKESYKDLINEYSNSKFRPQALYVLNFYFPDEGWNQILENEYPNSQFNLNNEKSSDTSSDGNIELERDKIWSECENSYNICAKKFLDLYNTRGDFESLYFYAFINDNYLNKLEESVNNYQKFLELSPESKFYEDVISRLGRIEDNIYSEIELANQKINYYYAVESLKLGEEIDSVLVKIEKAIDGSFSGYKASGQSIKSRLNKLGVLNKNINSEIGFLEDSLINQDINSKLDSLYFIVAKIYQLDFMMSDSSKYYFTKIVNEFENSNFRYQSLVSLSDMDKDRWEKLLIEEYPDSNYISDSSYKEIDIIAEIYNPLFLELEVNQLNILNSVSNLFKDDSTAIVDTNNIELDTLNKVINQNVE